MAYNPSCIDIVLADVLQGCHRNAHRAQRTMHKHTDNTTLHETQNHEGSRRAPQCSNLQHCAFICLPVFGRHFFGARGGGGVMLFMRCLFDVNSCLFMLFMQ